MSGGAFDVAKYLQHHNKSHEPVFIMTDPIIYWLNNQTPISNYIATPSTINKLYLIQAIEGPETSMESELKKILSKKPKFIVINSRTWKLLSEPQAQKLLQETLESEYLLDKIISGRKVYRRSILQKDCPINEWTAFG